MRLRVLIQTALLALFAVSASGSPAHAALDGYTRIRIKEAGITFVIPDDWEGIVMTRAAAKETLKNNPDMGVTVKELMDSPFSAGWEANPESQGFERWVDVRYQELPVAFLTPSLWKAAQQRNGAKEVVVARTKVAGRRALVTTAAYDFNLPDGTPYTGYMTQYAFANRAGVVVGVGFYGDVQDDPEYDRMIDTMIGSLRFL